jgi:hypothetical protein
MKNYTRKTERNSAFLAHANSCNAPEPTYLSDRIISLAEASVISGLSVDTLRRCHEREELRIIKLSPRRVGIRLTTLWAFIENRSP